MRGIKIVRGSLYGLSFPVLNSNFASAYENAQISKFLVKALF